ncbi:hypothetical protein GMDG_08947, partial [Pseudogymnoascus destructans 20631-21]
MKDQWKGDYLTMVRALTAFDQERRRNGELSSQSKSGESSFPGRARLGSSRFPPVEAAKTQPPKTTRSPLGSVQRTPFIPTAPKPDITGRVRTAVPAASGN